MLLVLIVLYLMCLLLANSGVVRGRTSTSVASSPDSQWSAVGQQFGRRFNVNDHVFAVIEFENENGELVSKIIPGFVANFDRHDPTKYAFHTIELNKTNCKEIEKHLVTWKNRNEDIDEDDVWPVLKNVILGVRLNETDLRSPQQVRFHNSITLLQFTI